MEHHRVSWGVARQLARLWETCKSAGFVDYLRVNFGCEPLKPVVFSGVFVLEMIGGYFFPELPAGPGPIVERHWLADENGFRASTKEELRALENIESDNSLVICDGSGATFGAIDSEPWLFRYPQCRFAMNGDVLLYHEHFGPRVGCKKTGKISITDRVTIEEVRLTWTIWQGKGKAVPG